MMLEVDAGNSRLKWRLVDVGGSCINCIDSGALNYDASLVEFLTTDFRFADVNCLLVSDVSKNELVHELCNIYNKCLSAKNVFIASAQKKLNGVQFVYQDIDRLGVDRCLGMVAAYEKFNAGVLVVDCGSAITADVVSAEGVHIGGCIIPGFNLLRSSLSHGTSDILLGGEVESFCGLGSSTIECVENGLAVMVRASLEAFVAIAKEHKVEVFVLTGGDAVLVEKLGVKNYIICEDLVFKGLEIVSPFTF